jgi:hypothetical protein
MILMLSKARAAEYLECSPEELVRWVEPDRTLPFDRSAPATRGMRLWSAATLEATKPHIEAWRERDRAAAEVGARHEFEREHAAAVARRKGMRNGGALMAGKVCQTIGCTRIELNRWVEDGRLPPDGEIVTIAGGKAVAARAWLPATIDAAKPHVAAWRERDSIARIARRRGLRFVG